ncbi:DUF402 domain-containing protein [Actinopolymorpha sp. B11F2]|uniref:DUF402 domain-containing protein n=1 Tax=Actinopolymorpha sp. B11F2 TaxID=3160862 RepID=UPI0032E51D59
MVADDEPGLLIWIAKDSTVMRRVTENSEPTRHLPYAQELQTPTTLQPMPYFRFGTLILTPPDSDHSVWWGFDAPGDHIGWYINLESPGSRWAGGIDLFDLALDVLVKPNGQWEWKDEDELAAQTGDPMFWTEQEARTIRARAEAVTRAIERKAFPFDGTWCDFVAHPDWEPTALPAWWDLPTTVTPRFSWPRDAFTAT